MYILKKSHSIWLTGIPSSGKTSISKTIVKKFGKKFPIIILDSDECNKFLFSKKNYSKLERKNSTLKYIKVFNNCLSKSCY